MSNVKTLSIVVVQLDDASQPHVMVRVRNQSHAVSEVSEDFYCAAPSEVGDLTDWARQCVAAVCEAL